VVFSTVIGDILFLFHFIGEICIFFGITRLGVILSKLIACLIDHWKPLPILKQKEHPNDAQKFR